MNADDGYSALTEIIEQYGRLKLEDANEATTRKLVIDEVLENVLGWDKSADISYEERASEDNSTTFADYVLRVPETGIVVEAKKIGESFHLPNHIARGKLGGVLSQEPVGGAIKQVRDYCRKLGVQFAVATNGRSWVIFPAVRIDNVTFGDTEARVFKDLADVQRRFTEFWELLSRERVIDGNLQTEFFFRIDQSAPNTLLHTYSEPGFRIGRNKVYEYIESTIKNVISDENILSDVKTLEHIYVSTSDRIKFDSRLQMHLNDLKPSLDRQTIRVKTRKKKKALDDVLHGVSESIPRFILLLGRVGAGKTTFLNYTRLISSRKVIDQKIIWIYIDFRKTTPSYNAKDFMYDEMLKFIDTDEVFRLGKWDNIQTAYRSYIQVQREGVLAPLAKKSEEEFIARIAETIELERNERIPFVNKILSSATEKTPVFLVVDNVDQIESSDFQRDIFIDAQAIARNIKASVILTIRDGTYMKHKQSPSFDAFQMDTFYIDPPQINAVLSKRLSYAKLKLSKKKMEIVSDSGKKFKVEDMGVFFDIVSKSVLSGRAGQMIEIFADGNIRNGLKLLDQFLSSGHVSSDNALKTYILNGDFMFPPHEVYKGVAFGDRKYYSEQTSVIPNIFDLKNSIAGNQLLRWEILSYLVSQANSPSYSGTAGEAIVADLLRIGIRNIDTIKAINSLEDFNLLTPASGLPHDVKTNLYPSRFGGYLVKELSSSFMYFEPCLIDSSIHDDEIWTKLFDISNEVESKRHMEKIEARILRSKIFLDYLTNLEETWIGMANQAKLDHHWCSRAIKKIVKPNLTNEWERIRQSASKIFEKEKEDHQIPDY